MKHIVGINIMRMMCEFCDDTVWSSDCAYDGHGHCASPDDMLTILYQAHAYGFQTCIVTNGCDDILWIRYVCVWMRHGQCMHGTCGYVVEVVPTAPYANIQWTMHACNLSIRCGSRPYCTLCKHSMDNLWLKFVHFSKPDGALEGT